MARPAKKPLSPEDLRRHRARADKAWSKKAASQWMVDDAYKYAIPYRKPGAAGEHKTDELFDDTAISSTFHGAGALKEDLFPSDQPFFELKPGPIADRILGFRSRQEKSKFKKDLLNITDQVTPYFQNGEFDQAAIETCLELYAGTGHLLPLAGTEENPVRFICIPTDECAIENGGYNDTVALFWRTKLSRRAIFDQWPKGSYPEDFRKALAEDPEAEVEICQDWWQDAKRWRYCAWLKGGDDKAGPIVNESYRTKPFVAARYHRVPGETSGRGPIQLALPSIKTANKAQELTLRSAAIRLMGIWGYRPGGMFDPDTARFAPGAFWAMSSTGGVMGPDVSRVDSASGDIQIGNLVSQDMKSRIQSVLNDDRLPDKDGSTPRSAMEIAAVMSKVKRHYIGAFGRLVNEIIPVLVARVMEILYDFGLLETDLLPDQLFVAVKVTSPLADAMKASHLQPLMQIIQLLGALGQDPKRFLDLDALIDDLLSKMSFTAKYLVTPDERKKIDEENEARAVQATAMQSLADNPEIVERAMQPRQERQAP